MVPEDDLDDEGSPADDEEDGVVAGSTCRSPTETSVSEGRVGGGGGGRDAWFTCVVVLRALSENTASWVKASPNANALKKKLRRLDSPLNPSRYVAACSASLAFGQPDPHQHSHGVVQIHCVRASRNEKRASMNVCAQKKKGKGTTVRE